MGLSISLSPLPFLPIFALSLPSFEFRPDSDHIISSHSIGLSVNNDACIALGSPEMGVYLQRHIDICLSSSPSPSTCSSPSCSSPSLTIFVFKISTLRVKSVVRRKADDPFLEPSPGFDAHVSQQNVANR